MAKTDYTKQELKKALSDIGIVAGDNIFIHSNIGFFGHMEGVTSANSLCENYLTALKDAVTESGTIVLPTFSYSFCHSEVYNPKHTKSDCGMLTTYSFSKGGFVRSLDPNFSMSVWGKNTDYYVREPAHESFGKNSFWERLLKTGGKLVCMNMDCGSTFVHYVERYCSVPYRYNKAFNGTIELDNGTIIKDYSVHYVNDGGLDGPCFDRLDKMCREAGICKVTNLGKGTMLSIDINEYFDLIIETLKKQPRFLTVGG